MAENLTNEGSKPSQDQISNQIREVFFGKKDPVTSEQPNKETEPAKVVEAVKEKPAEPVATEPVATEPVATEPANEVPDNQPQDLPVDDATEFFNNVRKLTGLPEIQVDYGNTDPLVPEGLAKRELALFRFAQEQRDKMLEQTDPRAYAYFLHRQSGGDDESFLESNKAFVLPRLEDLQTNQNLQQNLYRKYLLDRGVMPEVVDEQIKKLTKDNKLLPQAQAAYDQLRNIEQQQLNQYKQQQQYEQEQLSQFQNNIINAIGTQIVNENNNFIIPKTEQPVLLSYIQNNLRYDGEKLYYVNEINLRDPNALQSLVNNALFQYKKGDVSSLVKSKVAEANVQRLRLAMKETQKGKGLDTPKNEDKKDKRINPMLELRKQMGIR